MQIEIRSLSEITPYEQNPRKKQQPAIERLAGSLKKFGFRQPIVTDAEGVIVVGHRRFWAAQFAGLAEAPVHVAYDLTPEQCKEYRLADNKLAEDGEWDDTLLVTELLDMADLGIDTAYLGFDLFEDKQSNSAVPDGLLTDALAAQPEAAEPEKRLADRDHMVNACFYMSDIAVLEAAIKKTGEKNRAKALAAICKAYVADPLGDFEVSLEP